VVAIEPADIDKFYRSKTLEHLAPSSVAKVHAVLRASLQQGVRWRWVASNAAVSADPPRVPSSEPRPPTADELCALFEAARDDQDFATYLRLAAVTGLRRSELCGLRWENIDLEQRLLRIDSRVVMGTGGKSLESGGKTRASVRRVPLGDDSVTLLRLYQGMRCDLCRETIGVDLPSNSFVFSRYPDGREPWWPTSVNRKFREVRTRAGVSDEVLPHSLRKFMTTYLHDAGASLKTLQVFGGWSNAVTPLNIYAGTVEASTKAAAVMLDTRLRELQHPSKPARPDARRRRPV
jgi:integrase